MSEDVFIDMLEDDEQPQNEGLDAMPCSQCAEWRTLADDALNTLRITREKYGLGDRHVMREKNREITRLREALEAADELRQEYAAQLAEDIREEQAERMRGINSLPNDQNPSAP